MSSPVSSVLLNEGSTATNAIISPSFFAQYDTLQENAAHASLAQTELTRAETTLATATSEWQEATNKVTSNEACVEEQTKRIELVSKHWFYGTTACQPQLWFRGGCDGKIKRAQAKLEKALQDAPLLSRLVQDKQIQLPILRERVAECSHTVQVCTNAATQRARMKQSVVEQHPSPLSMALHQEALSNTNSVEQVQTTLRQLHQAETCHATALVKFKDAKKILQDAVTFEQQYETALRSSIQNSQQRSANAANSAAVTASAHNHFLVRCATPGCAFSKSSWHATHCCNACQDHSRKHRGGSCRHGKHCEQRVYRPAATTSSRSTGANDNLDGPVQRQLQQLESNLQAMVTNAQRHVDAALDQMRQGRTIVTMICSSNNSSSSSSSSSTGSPTLSNHAEIMAHATKVIQPPDFSSLLVTLTSTHTQMGHGQNRRRRDGLQSVLASVQRLESNEATMLAVHIQQLVVNHTEKQRTLQQEQAHIQANLKAEESRIFESIRSQHVGIVGDGRPLVAPTAPSAPPFSG